LAHPVETDYIKHIRKSLEFLPEISSADLEKQVTTCIPFIAVYLHAKFSDKVHSSYALYTLSQLEVILKLKYIFESAYLSKQCINKQEAQQMLR